MNNEAANAAAKFNWVMTAPMHEIEDLYCELHKDAHGVKARWIYGMGFTREQFVRMFEQLEADIDAAIEADRAADAAFMAMVDSLGLSDWAARNGIKRELDVWEHNYRTEYTPDPAPYPYDEMTVH